MLLLIEVYAQVSVDAALVCFHGKALYQNELTWQRWLPHLLLSV